MPNNEINGGLLIELENYSSFSNSLENASKLIAELDSTITELAQSFNKIDAQFANVDIFKTLSTGADQAARNLSTSLVEAFAETANDLLVSGRRMGDFLTQGFEVGLLTNVTSIIDTFVNRVLEEINRGFGIASPAERTKVVGRFFVEGFVVGVEQSTGLAEAEIRKFGSSTISELEKVAEQVSTSFNKIADSLFISTKEKPDDIFNKLIEAAKKGEPELRAFADSLKQSADPSIIAGLDSIVNDLVAGIHKVEASISTVVKPTDGEIKVAGITELPFKQVVEALGKELLSIERFTKDEVGHLNNIKKVADIVNSYSISISRILATLEDANKNLTSRHFLAKIPSEISNFFRQLLLALSDTTQGKSVADLATDIDKQSKIIARIATTVKNVAVSFIGADRIDFTAFDFTSFEKFFKEFFRIIADIIQGFDTKDLSRFVNAFQRIIKTLQDLKVKELTETVKGLQIALSTGDFRKTLQDFFKIFTSFNLVTNPEGINAVSSFLAKLPDVLQKLIRVGALLKLASTDIGGVNVIKEVGNVISALGKSFSKFKGVSFTEVSVDAIVKLVNNLEGILLALKKVKDNFAAKGIVARVLGKQFDSYFYGIANFVKNINNTFGKIYINPNIGTAIVGLTEGVEKLVVFLPRLNTALGAITKVSSEFKYKTLNFPVIKQIVEGLGNDQSLTALVNKLRKPSYNVQGISALGILFEQLGKVLNKITFTPAQIDAVDKISSVLPRLLNGLSQIQTIMATGDFGKQTKFGGLLTRFKDLDDIGKMFAALGKAVSKFASKTKNIDAKAVTAASVAVFKLGEALEKFFFLTRINAKEFSSSLRTAIPAFIQAIKDIDTKDLNTNVIKGIIQALPEFKKVGERAGVAVKEGTEDALGISSPSRVFKQIGQFAAEGFALGFRTVGDVVFDIFKGVITGVKHQLEGLVTNIQTTARDLRSGGRELFQFGVQALTTGGVASFLNSRAVNLTATFDQILNQIRVFGDISSSVLQGVENKILEFSAKTIFDPQQSANAFLDLQKAGLSVVDSLKVLPAVGDLAAAGELELTRATEVAITALKTYNLGVEETGRVADVLVRAANNSTASVEGLAQGLENVGPLAAQFGLSLEQTVAILALFNERGIKDAEAGTQLRSLITSLSRPTKEVTTIFNELGVSLQDNEGRIKDFNTIINELNKSMNETRTVTYRANTLTAEQRNQLELAQNAYASATRQIYLYQEGLSTGALGENAQKSLDKYQQVAANAQGLINEILGSQADAETITREISRTQFENFQTLNKLAGTYGQQGLAILLSEGEDAISSFIEEMNKLPGATKTANSLTQTFAGSVESLTGSVQTLIIKAFRPLLNKVLKPIIDVAIKFVNVLSELPESVLLVVSGTLVLVSALTSLTGVLAILAGLTIQGFGFALTAVGGLLSGLVALIFNPIGLIAGFAALTVAVATLVAIFASVAIVITSVIELAREIKNNVDGAGDSFNALGATIRDVSSSISNILNGIGDIIDNFRVLSDTGGQVVNAFKEMKDQGEKASGPVAKFFDGIRTALQPIRDTINEIETFIEFYRTLTDLQVDNKKQEEEELARKDKLAELNKKEKDLVSEIQTLKLSRIEDDKPLTDTEKERIAALQEQLDLLREQKRELTGGSIFDKVAGSVNDIKDTSKQMTKLQKLLKRFSETSIFQRLFGTDDAATLRAIGYIGIIQERLSAIYAGLDRVGASFGLLFSKGIGASIKELQKGLGAIILQIGYFVEDLFGITLSEKLKAQLTAGDFLGILSDLGKTILSTLANALVDNIGTIFSTALSTVFNLPLQILQWLGFDEVKPVQDFLTNYYSTLGTVLQDIVDVLTGDTTATDAANNIASSLEMLTGLDFSTLRQDLVPFLTGMKLFFDNVDNVAAQVFSDIVSTIGDLIDSAANSKDLQDLFAEVREITSEQLRDLGPAFRDLATSISEFVSNPSVQRVLVFLAKVVGVAIGAIAIGTITAALTTLKGVIESASGAIDILTGLFELIDGIASKDPTKVNDAFTNIGEGITKIVSAIATFNLEIVDEFMRLLESVGLVEYEGTPLQDFVKDAKEIFSLEGIGRELAKFIDDITLFATVLQLSLQQILLGIINAIDEIPGVNLETQATGLKNDIAGNIAAAQQLRIQQALDQIKVGVSPEVVLEGLEASRYFDQTQFDETTIVTIREQLAAQAEQALFAGSGLDLETRVASLQLALAEGAIDQDYINRIINAGINGAIYNYNNDYATKDEAATQAQFYLDLQAQVSPDTPVDQAVLDAITGAFGDSVTVSSTEDIGKSTVEGISTGITNNLSLATEAASGLATSISDTIKDSLGIFSPSTVTQGYGLNIVQGFVVGLLTNIPLLNGPITLIKNMFDNLGKEGTKAAFAIRDGFLSAANGMLAAATIIQISATSIVSSLQAVSAAASGAAIGIGSVGANANLATVTPLNPRGYADGGSINRNQVAQTNEGGKHEVFKDSKGTTYFLPGSSGFISPIQSVPMSSGRNTPTSVTEEINVTIYGNPSFTLDEAKAAFAEMLAQREFNQSAKRQLLLKGSI